jgi:hypothetical protein
MKLAKHQSNKLHNRQALHWITQFYAWRRLYRLRTALTATTPAAKPVSRRNYFSAPLFILRISSRYSEITDENGASAAF